MVPQTFLPFGDLGIWGGTAGQEFWRMRPSRDLSDVFCLVIELPWWLSW